MRTFFFLIDQLAIGIYIILAALTLWYLRRWFTQKSEFQSTQFELERDLARYRQVSSITLVIFFIQLALIVFGIQQAVVPVLASEQDLETILIEQQALVDGSFNTPTPPPVVGAIDIDPVEDLNDDDEVAFQPTPTPTPTPVGTIIAGAPPAFGCDTEQAQLTVPANGMRVFEPIAVRGTAFTDGFTSAKLEIIGPGTFDQYLVLDEKTEPIMQDSDFSQFVPTPYEPGVYQFRLVVFGADNQLQASCMVNIYITEPIRTATPEPNRG